MRRDVHGRTAADQPARGRRGDRGARALAARPPLGELPAPAGSTPSPLPYRSEGWLWYQVGCALAAAIYFALLPERPGGWTAAAVYGAVGLAAAAAVATGVARRRPAAAAAWRLVAAGLAAQAVGDTAGHVALSLDGGMPPSLADVAGVAGYGLLGAGLLALVSARHPGGRRPEGRLDALIITAGMGLLAWAFLVEPQTAEPVRHAVGKLVTAAYPIMDVLLLTAAVRLADAEADRAPLPVALRLVGVALALRLAADLAYGLAVLDGGYRLGDPIDLCYLASYACWGAAGLHRSMRDLSEPRPSRPARLTRPRIALLLAVSLLGPTLLAVQALRGREFPAALLLGAVAAVFALVLARFAALAGAEAARADTHERLLDRIVQATEEERRRVAAEIHEGPIQRLAGVAYTVELVRRRLARGQAASGRQLLETLERQLSTEIGALRRLMTELRPPVLDEWGLDAALSQVAAEFRRRTGIACVVDAGAAPRLDPSRETVLYRVAQEALANIARHAGARNVWISLSVQDGVAQLAIHDDGVGFNVDRPGDLLDRHHFGLVGMRQRVEMVGGTLEVRSRPGQGTVVSASLPMPAEGARG